MIISLLKFCYDDKLDKIFESNKDIISNIYEKFSYSFKKYSIFLKLIIILFLLLIIFINLIFIFIFLFKMKTNYFEFIIKIINNFPYLKNINNFITANLLLHIE